MHMLHLFQEGNIGTQCVSPVGLTTICLSLFFSLTLVSIFFHIPVLLSCLAMLEELMMTNERAQRTAI